MKSKKQKSVKPGSNIKKVPSDVSPSTSLPPLVEGQLRCFLCVTVSRVLWTIHKPPSPTFIRLRWWGESSNGTHFFPTDGFQVTQKTVKSTARYPIRCGPKQFTSYLTDMGSLVLEVLTKPDNLPIARAQVAGISRLSLSQPISGFYTLVSPTSEKLGEVQVSMNLEPLTEAYGISLSPIKDISPDRMQVPKLMVPLQPISLSAGGGKESAGSSGGNTPRGKDHLYFQNVQKDKERLENKIYTASKCQNSQPALNPLTVESSPGQRNKDIISVILERGNKLRNAMVESALKCDMESALPLKDSPLPLPKDNIQLPVDSFPSTSSMFLQDILHADSALKHSDDGAFPSGSALDCLPDMDKRAVDLLLGSSITSSLPLWDVQGSPPESLSGHSSVCGDSELNDPLYDQSLLENLFYKTPHPDTGPGVAGEDNQRTTLTSKSQPEKLTLSGPRISQSPNLERQQSADGGDDVYPPLSAEQFKLLSLTQIARVTIESLALPSGISATTTRKTFKGKPPRPFPSKKCTYFVEYVFPMTSASGRFGRSKAGDVEVTRAVSSKVTVEAVKFHQLSVFPVHFSAAAIKRWWETEIIFKIYSRKSDQKKPVAVGKAVHPLRSLLQSKELSQSVVLPVHSLEGVRGTQETGPLKVSIELGTHIKSFTSEKTEKLAVRDASPSKIAASSERETFRISQHVDPERESLPAPHLYHPRLNVGTPQKPLTEPSNHPRIQTSPFKSSQQVEEDPEVLLHALLMVPDGKNFKCGPLQAPNIFLNCKLFWCDETARSTVSWGQANPTFNFVQVTPVGLTAKLLERMKNNVMVIEVWQKTGSSGNDRLLGLAKLPLHQFYMSFRDPKITQLLLQAQYPVLGVDCYMPVIDVFSGSSRGNLRVLLAMGRAEQIVSLQRTRDEEYDSLSHVVRPVHMLDHQPHSQTKVNTEQVKIMREHVFVIRVEKVSGLTPLQSTVWGEADCYVQYTFPSQEFNTASDVEQSLIESSLNLKPFRTTTTLCVPDPVFGHTETHVLLAPEGVPVQRLLLSSLSSKGLSSGGIQFEVWCRYYYPNVRDQLVARGLLPLSKLCAMATMQRQHSNEAQMFSLPLVPRTEGHSGFQPQPSGLLDVCIRYKHRPVQPEGQAGRGTASRVVTLVVQVHRASGLKAAARAISEENDQFRYLMDVGLNPYITVHLSFLPETERRCTRTAARTFCPEFDHHIEVTCDMLLHMSSGETCSLAEQLEQTSAVFTVWNRDNHKATNVPKPTEIMLGTVKIPLVDLIYRRTGISGWFGLNLVCENRPSKPEHILVGGLEVSISFAHHSDRERVIKAAQGLGWEMPQSDCAPLDDEECWEEGMRKLSLTFSMPKAWLPLHCLLLPGLRELQRSTYCYLRYKFFDQDAFCSRLKHPCVEKGGEGNQAMVSFEGSRTVELSTTQPLMWYLREEKLEVQVWVTFSKNRTTRPSDSDRLLGSAFVDLSSLATTPMQKLSLSGVYPLFMRSAADLQGAALRVHITSSAGPIPTNLPAAHDTQVDSDIQEEILLGEVEEANGSLSSFTPRKPSHDQSTHRSKPSRATPDITSVHHTEVSVEDSFPVTVAVDRAMHLNLKGCPLAERTEGTPCCCVSYVTADSSEPVSTSVVTNTDCPVWDHQHECRLSKELLVDPQQSLVFKVWHKGEIERVIGFATVDLSPLLWGFPSVCGWYNITDFSGQCHGQIKVSVTPLRGVQDLRGQRKNVTEEAAKTSSALFQAVPLSYQTTAMYSSFPSHISRFPEQKISSPNHSDKMSSERPIESDRHIEHMDKVRLYHQNLQEQTASHFACGGSTSDIHPSSSFLFSALKRKLSELDNIQRYFNRKLSTPTFPPTTEQDNQEVDQRLLETDTSQLLLKSNQLVGEVNNIVSGLRGQFLETIPSDTQSSSNSPVEISSPQLIPDSMSSPNRAIDECLGVGSSLPLLPTKISQHHRDSDHEEEEDKHSNKDNLSEEEHQEETDFRQDEEGGDDEEDEDFEEVVLKPRHLNEVTTLTDRTSPWTSILSEPDLVSVESIESDMSENEDTSQVATLESGVSNEKHIEEVYHHSSDESARDASDTERDFNRMQSIDQTQQKESNNPNKSSDTSPTPQPATDFSTAGTQDINQKQLQPLLPVEVPNFFLPSQQLEASLRAIRLAPSFSQTSYDSDQNISDLRIVPHRRGPRQRPDMSPSSLKKQTERIAKIFAANFDKSS
ncbi:C2 domain-containing protein 3 isoform X1 [Girardinichthys multiradiatus]|uniref:C2 domain-containing protein 3 isoform X1 n=1 Tax=Girardinichthys multiradiatus TaxID=208333 RepID=UPI001FACE77A|nr:C2 domain-containing protein 3 isoform X1 [Girardinichthys multiradiatus]